MLNKIKKKFIISNADNSVSSNNFLQQPKISKNYFVQVESVKNFNLGFDTVFNQVDPKISNSKNIQNNRFVYNSRQFRQFLIFNKLRKMSAVNSNNEHFKTFFFFVHCILKEKKKVPFYLLKRIKGGYMISVLGIICFVPRSLFKISTKQQLIGFKLYKKSKKFTRSSLKLNLVSSLIQKNS
jgi:hypothetical protein